MAMQTLEDVLKNQLKDLYSAGNQAVDALPEVANASKSPQLQDALNQHVDETKEQLQKLEKIAQIMDFSLEGEFCHGMEGLIKEAKEHVGESEEGAALDATIIAAVQRMQHYGMAGYGSSATYARQLNQEEVESILNEILEEEKSTDLKLSQLAESSINQEARA